MKGGLVSTEDAVRLMPLGVKRAGWMGVDLRSLVGRPHLGETLLGTLLGSVGYIMVLGSSFESGSNAAL